MIKNCLFFLLIAALLPFCGCYDAVEIDDLAYVVAVGIDKGSQKTYQITLQYAVPLNIASGIDGSPGEESPLSALTIETDSMHLALEIANGKLAKMTDFSHLNVILLGENAAKTDLSYLREDIQTLTVLPKDACLAVCKGDAADKLNTVSSPLELNPSRYYTDFFSNPSSGFGLKQPLSAFLTPTSALALPFLGESETFEITEMAILKEDTLFRLYPKEDILLFNLLAGDFQDLKYETEHGVYRLDARTMPKITVQTKGAPVISVSLDLTGEPLSGKAFLFADNQKATADICEKLKTDLSAFLQKSTQDGCDIFQFSKYAKIHFLTEKELKNYNWDLKYPVAVFSVHVRFRNTKNN